MHADTTPTSSCDTAGGRKRILVVEDDRPLRTAVGELLAGEGYEVLLAADGSEALHYAQHDEPDLMLLDLALPSDPFGGGNFDGFGVMQWLGRGDPDHRLATIIVTARQDAAARQRAAELGAVGYFTKPFVQDELMGAIRMALGND